MKIKVISVFCALLVLVSLLVCTPLAVSGGTLEEGESAQRQGVSAGENAPEGSFSYYYGKVAESFADLFSKDNLGTLITWGCSVLSVLIVSLLRSSVSKLKNKISSTLDKSTLKTNELIEGYNKNNLDIAGLAEKTDGLYRMLEEKCALDRSVSEKVDAFAQMLFLVYNGSTTLPEGLKDVLRVKYAKLLSEQESESEGERV